MADSPELHAFKSCYPDLPLVQAVTDAQIVQTVGGNLNWNTLTPSDLLYNKNHGRELISVTPFEAAMGAVVFDVVCLAVGAWGLRPSANPAVFGAMGQAVAPVLSRLETIIAGMSGPGATTTSQAWGVYKILSTIYSGGSLGAVIAAFKQSLTWWNAILFGVTGIATIVAFVATDGLAFVAEVVIVLAGFGSLAADVAHAVQVYNLKPVPDSAEPTPHAGPSSVRPSVALLTGNRHNYLTVVNNGGLGGPNSGNSVIHTDARTVGPWEKFKLVPLDVQSKSVALQTVNGHYVTAVNAGGLGGPNTNGSIIHTDATAVGPWESLVFEQQVDGTYAIRTTTGFYLTAVNGGGMGGRNDASCIIHTDASRPQAWETFYLQSL